MVNVRMVTWLKANISEQKSTLTLGVATVFSFLDYRDGLEWGSWPLLPKPQ